MTEKIKLTRKDLRMMHRVKVAALKAEHALEVTEYEADLQASKGREALLRTSLADANRAWSRASAQLRIANVAVDALREGKAAAERGRDAAYRNVEDAVASGDEARNELADLRRQLRAIRAAWGPLQQAVFPWKITGATGTILDGLIDSEPSILTEAKAQYPQAFPGTNYFVNVEPPMTRDDVLVVRDDGQIMEESAYFSWQDKVDRLHEAGYSCATGKAKQEQQAACASYSGLR